MVQQYLIVRAREHWRRKRAQPFLLVWDTLKIIFSLRVLQVVWMLKTGAIVVGLSLVALPVQQVVSGAVLGVVALAQLGINLAEPLSADPYARFWSFPYWFLRWASYSALTFRVVFVTLMLALLWGWHGFLIGVVCYGVSLIGTRWPLAHAVAGVCALVLLAVAPAPILVFLFWAGFLAASMVRAWRGSAVIAMPHRSRPRTIEADVLLSKEVACITYFQSDRVYLVLNSLVAIALLFMVVQSGQVHAAPTRLSWALPIFCVLPYSRISFNLFGTESSGMGLYLRDPAATAEYAWRRQRIYAWISYAFGAATFLRLLMLYSWSAAAGFAAALVLTVELLLPCALLLSVAWPEPKPLRYSQWENMRAATPKITALIYLCVAAVVAYVQHVAGLSGLVVAALLVLLCNARVVAPLAQQAISHGFPKTIYG